MFWSQEWRAISFEISGLLEAGKLYFLSCVKEQDPSSVGKLFLIPQAKGILDKLESFSERYLLELSQEAVSILSKFLPEYRKAYERVTVVGDGPRGVQSVVIPLAGFQAEFESALKDVAELSKSRVERAFLHLQRSIAVDEELRRRWQEAFEHGETRCETLGAIHLLSHGIWSFKADSPTAKTDLVFEGEKIVEPDTVQKTGSILVLTEWKRLTESQKGEKMLENAFNQAKQYSSGILGGFELASRRYLIIVSEANIKLPPDRIDGTIIYRHINIAVAPSKPSTKARNS